jgi:DNA-directed RNA polymerase subunit RPC12/RpoP
MATDYYECEACGYRGVHAITVGAGNVRPADVAADETDRKGEFACPNCGAQQMFTEPADMSQPWGLTPPIDEPDVPSLGPTTAETIQGSPEQARAGKGGK